MLERNRLIINQILILSSIIYALIFVLGYVFQRHFIYFPSVIEPNRKLFHAEDMQVITVSTSDHLSLKAWYKPAQPHQATLIYFHGNAGHIGNRMFLARQFLSQGLGVLLLEYRGYGGNPGSPTEEGLYQDGRAAVDFLKQRGVKKIMFFGASLGTGIATKLATEFEVCGVILQSPYTSFDALRQYHYPLLPIPLRDHFDSLTRVPTIHVPLLILYGRQDTIVPYAQSERLFQQANTPKERIIVEEKGHNDVWDDEVAHEVFSFIEKYATTPNRLRKSDPLDDQCGIRTTKSKVIGQGNIHLLMPRSVRDVI